MRKQQLLFSNEILLEDARKMKLDYNLTEKSFEADQEKPFYGIQITKQLGNTIEMEEVTGISYSKETVISVIKKLFQYEVTPISLVEVLDDIITEGI